MLILYFYIPLTRKPFSMDIRQATFASVNGCKRGKWNLLKFSERNMAHICYVGECSGHINRPYNPLHYNENMIARLMKIRFSFYQSGLEK